MNFIIDLFNHYGYWVLLISLLLELIAFPLPGEALMTYCGYAVYMNKMSWTISILVASIGAVIGITISYFIGKFLGGDFFDKYGHHVHLNKKRIDKVSIWFQDYGNKLLIMAYFIPGVRHITGYFSGITRVSYKKFAVNAYLGAFIWTFTFITLGKLLGENWGKYHSLMSKYLVIASLIIAIIVVTIYIYRSYKQNIKEWFIVTLKNGIKIFHSLGKIKVLIAGIASVFLVFSILVIGIIQDYLANEFGQFDEIVKYLITKIFNEEWNKFMKLFNNMASINILLIVAISVVIWTAIKGNDKLHDIKFQILSFLGAVGLDMILKNIFHRFGPTGTVYTFPSGEALMSVVVYGFPIYMFIKQCRKTWINSILIGFYLIFCFLIGLSLVYFNIQFPSDVAAGLEFGVVWLSLSIILLETYRVLPKINN